jgi:deoxyribonuclease-4
MPAGIPPSTPNVQKLGVVAGVNHLREINLDGMELEFVRQVYLNEKTAHEVKQASKDDLLLTAHGSYFINLNAVEKQKVHESKERILKAARMLWLAGGYSLTFHAAYYLKDEKSVVYDKVKSQ